MPKALLTHPFTLIACLLGGGVLGLFQPPGSGFVGLIGEMFSRLLEMAALPLLMVATIFGLRNLLGLPQRGRRLLTLVCGALGVMLLAGLAGALLAQLTGPGRDLPLADQQALGALILKTGAASDSIALSPGDDDEPRATPPRRAIPDNVFAALVRADLKGMLLCALFLGLAFAAQPREKSKDLAHYLEAVYRTLEILISKANLLLPLLAFCMALQITSSLDPDSLPLLGHLLQTLLLATLLLAVLAIALISHQARCHPWETLIALREPLTIGLVSPTPAAAIPSAIEALSERLGFSRGIAELLVPVGSIFQRAGLVLHTAVVTMFVAQLYGESPAWMLVGVQAALATLMLNPSGQQKALAPASLVLLWQQIPFEAVFPMLLLADRLCQGPRQVLGLLCIGALSALTNKGLLSEKRALPAPETVLAPWRMALTRRTAGTILACIILAGGLVTLAGIGTGIRMNAPAAPPSLHGNQP